MTSPRQRVPMALRIAAWLLPRDAREEVLGDLVEAWKARARTQSGWARALWTLRQPFVSLKARVGARPWHGSGASASPLGVAPRRRGLGFSSLDVKLGVRMLGKQPVLTLVAGLTLALGIPSALLPTHVVGLFFLDLPVDEGDRVLGLRNWDLEANRQSLRNLHDYEVWKQTLTSFESLAAVRSAPWNVHSADGRAAEVRGAEVSASLFPLLRVPPLLGRTLLPADEFEGAPDVVVISEDLWASRFARDLEIVGRAVTVGRRPHTVVGVMPEGFLFPNRDHLWLPFRAKADDYPVGAGPDVFVVGRLADNASREVADLELQTVGARLATEWPETHGRLRAEAVPFPLMALGERAAGPLGDWEVVLIQLFFLGLLAIACGNIGTLILARTATRLDEIAVRTALGASRARILGQLFIESLVLAIAATAVGLVLAREIGTRIVWRMALDIPYWFDVDLSLRTTLVAFGVGAGCAVIAGVLPAVKATSPRIQQNLQRGTRGATVRFGTLTTVLIVAEVALSVGFLCFGTIALLSFVQNGSARSELAVDRYLVASLRTPWIEPPEELADTYEEQFRARTALNQEELRDRLAADPAVRRVAMGQHLPGTSHRSRTIVIEGTSATDDAPNGWIRTGTVHVDFFRDLGLQILQGRGFTQEDVDGPEEAHRPAIVVNQAFVEHMLGGGEAVGTRIRYRPEVTGGVEEWYEIVGVVETFGTNVLVPERSEALYHPLASAELNPMRYVIEVAGSPAAFLPALRGTASEVDPEATIENAQPLVDVIARTRLENRVATWLIFGLSAVGMLLAVTGLYALMSFTVSQRTREIGIRTALGARSGDVVMTIARRTLTQLLFGVGLGSIGGWWIVYDLSRQTNFVDVSVPGVVFGVATAVIALSVLACLSPTLRGLRIQPTEALSES